MNTWKVIAVRDGERHNLSYDTEQDAALGALGMAVTGYTTQIVAPGETEPRDTFPDGKLLHERYPFWDAQDPDARMAVRFDVHAARALDAVPVHGKQSPDAWVRITDHITGLPVEIRRYPCGLGCKCDKQIR